MNLCFVIFSSIVIMYLIYFSDVIGVVSKYGPVVESCKNGNKSKRMEVEFEDTE